MMTATLLSDDDRIAELLDKQSALLLKRHAFSFTAANAVAPLGGHCCIRMPPQHTSQFETY
jgi:hypothetical protein